MFEAISAFAIEHFVGIKATHILAATLWSFSVLAPMVFYIMPAQAALANDPGNAELTRRHHWVLEQFDHVVFVEHAALFVMLGSGLLLYSTGVADFSMGWFAVKMAILVGFFIPLEIYDIWICHIKAPRMTKIKDLDPEGYAKFRDYYFRYLKGLGIPIILTVPTTLLLALLKPF